MVPAWNGLLGLCTCELLSSATSSARHEHDIRRLDTCQWMSIYQHPLWCVRYLPLMQVSISGGFLTRDHTASFYQILLCSLVHRHLHYMYHWMSNQRGNTCSDCHFLPGTQQMLTGCLPSERDKQACSHHLLLHQHGCLARPQFCSAYLM